MAATGAPILGKLCRAYVEPTATIEGGTWEELGRIQGLTKNGSRNVAEIAEREEEEVLVLVSHKTREISFDITRRPGSAGYDAVEAAFEGGTKIGLTVLTGDIEDADSRGYQAEVYVTQFDDDQGHEATTVSVTCRPAADYTTAPAAIGIALAEEEGGEGGGGA